MISHSFTNYVFIRASIFLLHYFAPLLILCLILTLVIDHEAHRLTVLLEILSIAEIAFYVLVFIPKYRLLQRPAIHPPVRPREERRRIFLKGCETIADPESYLSKWFNGAALSDIRRENVKEFYCWAFFNRAAWGPEDEEELDEYADKVDELMGWKVPPGRGPAIPIKLTLDPVNILHRPLVWYMIVGAVDTFTYIYLTLYGFRFYRLRLSRFLTVFPPRVITLSSFKTTPSDTVSYWYRPHNSKTRRPMVFIHGIGIGLFPYVNFLTSIQQARGSSADGQIGILVIELMPICARITGEMPDQEPLCAEIMRIVDRHYSGKFVLVANSYGSVVTANLLKRAVYADRIASVLLVDPVVFLLQLPDVAYNFTRRKPRRANEHQLYYFASTDMCVAHTIARKFFWMQNILWKEDLADRNVTVVLGGRDLIVDTNAVGQYLAEDGRGYERFLNEDENDGDDVPADKWKNWSWKGEGVDIVWLDHCDHAQAFEKKQDYRKLVDIVRSYCADTD